MRGTRWFEAIVTGALILIALAAALLFIRINDAVTANRHFICAFGSAVSEQPLKRRNAETVKEFKQRVKATKHFVRDLETELKDCEVPTVIVVDPESKKELREERRERQREERVRRQQERRAEGGDPSSSPPQGQGQPGGNDAPDLPNIHTPDIQDPVGPGPGSFPPPGPLPPEVKGPVCELWENLMPPIVEDPVAPLVCP